MIVYPAYAYMGKAPAKAVYGFVGTAENYEKADWVSVEKTNAAEIRKIITGIYKIVIGGSLQYIKHINILDVKKYRKKYLKFDYDKSDYSRIEVYSENSAGTSTIIFSDTSTSIVQNKEVAVEIPANCVKIMIANTTSSTSFTVNLNNIRYED